MRHLQLLALVAVMFVSSLALGQETSNHSGKSSGRGALERQLFEITQRWLESERTKKVDDLRELWTDKFFEVSGQGVFVTKEEMLQRFANPSPSQAAFPINFKLKALYGNVAITTESTTLRSTAANGQEVTRELRHLRIFVKENGKWRPAASSTVPTVLR